MPGVTLHIRSTPSAVVKAWIANRRAFIDAARTAAPFKVPQDSVLELLEMFLATWEREADAAEVFEWTYEIDPDVLGIVAKAWLDLGEIPADQRAAIGVPLPPPETEAFTRAVFDGMVEACRHAGADGQRVLDRLGL